MNLSKLADAGALRIAWASQNLSVVWLVFALALLAGALIVLPLTTAVAVIGGALLALALLRWHDLGLYIAIVAVPYGSWFPVQISVGNLTAVDLFVALLIALWFARMMAHDRAIKLRLPPLTGPLALFLFAALLSTINAVSLQYAIKEFVKWLELFAMYLYVANTLDAAKAKRVLGVLFLAGLSQAAIGIYQFVFKWGPEGFLLFGRFIRAFGTFEQPNPYAGYLAIIIPVALGVVLGLVFQVSSVRLSHDRSWSIKLEPGNLALLALAGTSLAAMLVASVMSWSRGAWFGLGAGMIVTGIVQSRRAFVFSVIAAFMLTFVILMSSINIIPTAIAERFSGVADYFGVFDVRGIKVDDANFAIVERMAHWQAAVEMFSANPVTGVGIGNYAPAYPTYALPHWSDPLGHAHNYYLNIAAETGLIGLLAYLFLWGAAIWQSWHAIRRIPPQGMWRSVAAGLLGMLVALSVHNTFDNLFVHGMAVQVGIGLGLVVVIDSARSGRPRGMPLPPAVANS